MILPSLAPPSVSKLRLDWYNVDGRASLLDGGRKWVVACQGVLHKEPPWRLPPLS
jgi:hypothetical protein